MGCFIGKNKKITKIDNDPKNPSENKANFTKTPFF